MSEALLLEANLIKRFKPRFNIRLKDDKSYPYIKITLADDFPRVERTRKLPKDGSRYFGPYASASSVDEAMNLVRRLFPFRTCTIEIKDGERALPRPCLLYHIKRCQGPCIEAIRRRPIAATSARSSCSSRATPTPSSTASATRWRFAAEQQQYEKAAVVRDKIRSIERTMESQKMAAFARTELDLVALARKDDQAAVQLFVVRNGKMLGRDVFFLDAQRDVPDDEVLGSFLEQYYARATSVPREVLVPRSLDRDRGPRGVPRRAARERRHLRTPQRGEKRELMELATRNAAETLAREAARWLADEGRTLGALEELAAALGLAGPPMRIECYDISNFQGAGVGRQHGGVRGGPAEDGRVPAVPDQDRPGRQRLREPPGGPAPPVPPGGQRARRGRGGAPLGDARPRDHRRRPRPGQRRQGGPRRARPARPAAGRPGQGARGAGAAGPAPSRCCCRSRPRRCTSSSGCATRPTGSRSRTTATCARSGPRSSAFDDLPGVGPKRRRELLKVFGSAKRVREAPVEQIAAVPGISRALAEKIKAHLEA